MQLTQQPSPQKEARAIQCSWPDSSLPLDPETVALARIYAVLRRRAQEIRLARQAATPPTLALNVDSLAKAEEHDVRHVQGARRDA